MKYYSLNQYLQDTFGEKIYKISIDGGFTCPNRDGTKGTGGCIFCSGAGSGDFAESRCLSITEQIELGKKKVAKKYKGNKFIAYFQAFTNTYAPVNRLRSVYTEAITHPDVVAVSIATRPDCLDEEILDLLSELNKIKPIWIELGLQTIREDLARYIRRGYDLSVYDQAMKSLKKRGMYTIVHIILGLPGSYPQDMVETVDYVVKSGADGLKLQLLHVIKGTELERDYLEGKFSCLDMEEYVKLVVECLKHIPENVAVHRITGDGDKKTLVAPMWSADKKRVLNTLNKAISEA